MWNFLFFGGFCELASRFQRRPKHFLSSEERAGHTIRSSLALLIHSQQRVFVAVREKGNLSSTALRKKRTLTAELQVLFVTHNSSFKHV
ncbi:hypothetical protein TNCT_641751 [Trichonephila clavata]|uniref:Uncharacterized protein n=1 Tax=Trichonephila clavata TaxID=2740835 RepID=A0A8X6FBJ5_TRICU|nr:hypothetical protein TNCT_641751 [Trichonephila clavata]